MTKTEIYSKLLGIPHEAVLKMVDRQLTKDLSELTRYSEGVWKKSTIKNQKPMSAHIVFLVEVMVERNQLRVLLTKGVSDE